MKCVTFCGHGEIHGENELKEWLERTVEDLIKNGAEIFLLGGYGRFDSMAALTVWDLKKRYPHIKSTLVVPYLDRKYPSKYYDDTLYPSLENVPKRFAISKRNEWMVNEADVVVAYVIHSWGGAAKTLEYAERKKKKIINFKDRT